MVQFPTVRELPERLFDLDSYNFYLPEHLIADRPHPQRDQARLLIYHQASGGITHGRFTDILQQLGEGDELVLNQTQVVSCRLIGRRPSGGQAEIFVLNWQQCSSIETALFDCLVKASGQRKIGETFHLAGNVQATIQRLATTDQEHLMLSFSTANLLEYLQAYGLMPIPPYIRKGMADERDQQDYQTVFSGQAGSVAAPTAGLHFTRELLANCQQRGIGTTYLNLHVGRGTFAPIKVQDIRHHRMHAESFSVEAESASTLAAKWGGLTAVGTTSLRTLESIARYPAWFEALKRAEIVQGTTDIFLYPGQKTCSIKNLITNFHLPQSSLFILVSALIGREVALELYQLAIKEQYRFFSYGDAMMIQLAGKT